MEQNLPFIEHLRHRIPGQLSKRVYIPFIPHWRSADIVPYRLALLVSQLAYFRRAALLSAFCDLDHATFDHAFNSINSTCETGVMRLCKVEKSQVKLDEDHEEAVTQDTESSIGRGKQAVKDTAIMDVAHVSLPLLPTAPLDRSGMPRLTPSMSQQDANITLHPLPYSRDSGNKNNHTTGTLLSRPNLTAMFWAGGSWPQTTTMSPGG